MPSQVKANRVNKPNQANHNKRLAYILFSIALVFFLGIVLKRVILA